MSALILACCAVVTCASAVDDTESTAAKAHPQRKLFDISNDLSDAMRREAVAASNQQRAAAIARLCELFTELRTDPRIAYSEPLQRYAIRARSRLRRVKQDLEKSVGRENAGEPLVEPSSATSAPGPWQNVSNPAVQLALRSLTDQFEAASALSGGPAVLWSAGGDSGAMGGGTTFDFGPQLIELIQRTIDPDFWDVAGGPGTMYYYRPLFALVVRATDEIHEKIGGFVGKAR